MSMSKQDFIALADTVREFNREQAQLPEGVQRPFTHSQLGALASFCKGQNIAFMPSRWLDYIEGKVGPGGGKPKG